MHRSRKARSGRRRVGLPAAKWMAEIGAFVLRTDTKLLLESRRVVPARLHRPRGGVAPAAPLPSMTLARAAMSLYIAVYSALIVFAAAALALRPGGFVLCERRYWRYLAAPWKLVLFVVAFVGIVAIAPWTGDRTWDHVDAGFMAALAFTTAPWSVGVLYQSARFGRLAGYVALIALPVALAMVSFVLLELGIF